MEKTTAAVVYTAIYGAYDDLKIPPPQDIPCDFICFTDNEEINDPTGTWHIIVAARPPEHHPRMQAKWFKLMSHEVFPDGRLSDSFGYSALAGRQWDFAIWIDGSVQIRSAAFAREITGYVADNRWAIFTHSERDCIYDEGEYSVCMVKYKGQPIAEQTAAYKRSGHPAHWGLWECTVIVRDAYTPAKLKELNEAWWQENWRWSYQDQISLPYLLRKHQVGIDKIKGYVNENEWFDWLASERPGHEAELYNTLIKPHLERIIAAADILNDSIQCIDSSKNVAQYRDDLYLKVALAYYFQGDAAKAVSFSAEARKVAVRKKPDELFGEVLGYWEQVFAEGNDFASRLLDMTESQKMAYEIMCRYSVLSYHLLPAQYREAVACVASGQLFLCSRNMRGQTERYADIPLYRDILKGLYFTEIDGKKLYYNDKNADQAYSKMRAENAMVNSAHSPHLYFTDDFHVNEGDVFCDIGAAEANMALAVVDKCEHVYVFEGDEAWEKAHQGTFAPYMRKTTLVKKMVSDASGEEGFITLDEYFGDAKVDFLKMNVEGCEMSVLRGAEKVLENNHGIKLLVCTYYKSEDAVEIKAFLEARGFTCEFSEGFMVFTYDEQFYNGSDPAYPYFRHGLIRAWRYKQ